MSPSYSLWLLWDWQGGKVTLLSHLMRLIKCVCGKLSAEKAVFVKGFWLGAQKVREIRADYCCILIFLSLERITKYHHWKYTIGISKPIWALKIEEAGSCFQGASGYFYIETCRQTEGCSSHTQVYWLQASCEQGPGTAISTQSWASAGWDNRLSCQDRIVSFQKFLSLSCCSHRHWKWNSHHSLLCHKSKAFLSFSEFVVSAVKI